MPRCDVLEIDTERAAIHHGNAPASCRALLRLHRARQSQGISRQFRRIRHQRVDVHQQRAIRRQQTVCVGFIHQIETMIQIDDQTVRAVDDVHHRGELDVTDGSRL